jgi:hypothetical protein
MDKTIEELEAEEAVGANARIQERMDWPEEEGGTMTIPADQWLDLYQAGYFDPDRPGEPPDMNDYDDLAERAAQLKKAKPRREHEDDADHRHR